MTITLLPSEPETEMLPAAPPSKPPPDPKAPPATGDEEDE